MQPRCCRHGKLRGGAALQKLENVRGRIQTQAARPLVLPRGPLQGVTCSSHSPCLGSRPTPLGGGQTVLVKVRFQIVSDAMENAEEMKVRGARRDGRAGRVPRGPFGPCAAALDATFPRLDPAPPRSPGAAPVWAAGVPAPGHRPVRPAGGWGGRETPRRPPPEALPARAVPFPQDASRTGSRQEETRGPGLRGAAPRGSSCLDCRTASGTGAPGPAALAAAPLGAGRAPLSRAATSGARPTPSARRPACRLPTPDAPGAGTGLGTGRSQRPSGPPGAGGAAPLPSPWRSHSVQFPAKTAVATAGRPGVTPTARRRREHPHTRGAGGVRRSPARELPGPRFRLEPQTRAR